MDNEMMLAQLEYLQGQVTALQAAIRGLICVHPHPADAVQVVERMLEETQANGLASGSASEASLLGLDRSPHRLLPTAAQMRRAQSKEELALPWL